MLQLKSSLTNFISYMLTFQSKEAFQCFTKRSVYCPPLFCSEQQPHLSGKPNVWGCLAVLRDFWSNPGYDRMHNYTSVTCVGRYREDSSSDDKQLNIWWGNSVPTHLLCLIWLLSLLNQSTHGPGQMNIHHNECSRVAQILSISVAVMMSWCHMQSFHRNKAPSLLL